MNPEESKNTGDLTKPRNTLGNSISSALFYLAILFFIIGFNFSDVMVGNWYQQFMPTPIGGQIRDLVFMDSLLGFAVSDSCIIKTTNGGNNWNIKENGYYIFKRIYFIDNNTGYACAGNNKLLKTTNSGENWTSMVTAGIFPNDMAVLNKDTILLVDNEGTFGGLFRTTNGGAGWQELINFAPGNPDRIYMFNVRIGFISIGNQLRKTTNGGMNWNLIVGTGSGAFNDLYFIDSLTGWKAKSVGGGGWLMGKTTDGGFNWQEQFIPSGTNLVVDVKTFSNINKDSIWAGGGYKFFPGNGNRGVLYFTSNSGDTWRFQLPDTSFRISQFPFVQFENKRNGWGYSVTNQGGIHTTNGGDTTFYLPVQQISTEIPNDYRLFQNYPNPFNPNTNIRYNIKSQSSVKIIVFNIQGKQITELINEKQNAGTYEVNWDASAFSSGVYFYSLIIDGITASTKKMILLK